VIKIVVFVVIAIEIVVAVAALEALAITAISPLAAPVVLIVASIWCGYEIEKT
jgi:hypothetical protein